MWETSREGEGGKNRKEEAPCEEGRKSHEAIAHTPHQSQGYYTELISNGILSEFTVIELDLQVTKNMYGCTHRKGESTKDT